MDTRLPLMAQAPQIDVSKLEAAAQQAHARDQASQLNQFKINDMPNAMAYQQKQRDFSGKQMDYKGTEMDMEAKAGHPELAQKLMGYFNGMKPEQYQAAMTKTRDMRDSYNRIMTFPPGSDEQKQILTQEADRLLQNGVIDRRMHDWAIKTGPSPLLMDTMHNQLTALEQATRGAPPIMNPLQDAQAKEHLARAGYFERGGATGRPKDALTVTNQIGGAIRNLQHEMGLDSPNYNPTPPQRAADDAKFEQRKQEIYKSFGANQHGLVVPQGTPGAATVGTGTPGSVDLSPGGGAGGGDGSGTLESPHAPQSIEELQAIPDGEWYTNPADGLPYQRDSTLDSLG